MSYKFPIPGFYFSVDVDGDSISFQEVGGLEFQIELEDMQGDGRSGGHSMGAPKKRKPGNLVLKRGVASEKAGFFTWIYNSFHYEKSGSVVTPKDIDIFLLDPGTGGIVRFWRAYGAFPTKWSFANLHSQKNEILIETVEFQLQDLEMILF
ncbi:MAG: phage tail protein [Bacteroidota bacterium]